MDEIDDQYDSCRSIEYGFNLHFGKVRVSLLFQSSRSVARRAQPSQLMHWLVNLGGIGVFGISVVDSSMIPLPIPGSTDLLLLILAVRRSAAAIYVCSYVVAAIAGSIIGGYITWKAGQKGGLTALQKHVPARILSRVTGWVERRGPIAIAVAALLPPPIPLMPFLLAAGALGIPRNSFLLFYSAARIVRYSVIGWLGYTYGRHVVRLWQHSLAVWSTPILCIWGGLVALGLAYGLWKFVQQRRVTA